MFRLALYPRLFSRTPISLVVSTRLARGSHTMGRELVRVGSYGALLSHSRFFLNLRSREGTYHSLILFRLTDGPGLERDAAPLLAAHSDTSTQDLSDEHRERRQLYAMESACPHLGADMSHADIEDYDTGPVAVCPWHRYDFDLATGESMSGLRACTYTVHVREDEDVWVEAPSTGGRDWVVVELRPVSEAFADPPPPPPAAQINGPTLTGAPVPAAEEPVTPVQKPPRTLVEWAVLILNTADPSLKVARTRHAVHLFRTGQLAGGIGHKSRSAPCPPDVPPRHETYMQNVVTPIVAGKRKNRVAMLHALANIEQWAVDLAWDIIARFGPQHPDLPPAFFADFARMALDESKHFTLLCARLGALAPGTPYGALPVHAGLWDSARATFGTLRARLAIIHLVHEARGLDVNPGTIEKFRRSGDGNSVEVLETIHADEVTHVTTGHRWFVWCCERDGVDPVQTFREEVRRGFMGEIKGPFNAPARETAGMTPAFYEGLRGELDLEQWTRAAQTVGRSIVGESTLQTTSASGEEREEIHYER